MQFYKKADLTTYSASKLLDIMGPTQMASATIQAYRTAMLDNKSPAEIRLAKFEEKTELIKIQNPASENKIV